jgi:CRISPR system Cascade subunit CasC
MQLELHLLQSFPPANLNRDENGMPKSTVFGGRPRARISSQCQKRAARLYYQEYGELDNDLFAKRSKNWASKISEQLTEKGIEQSKAEIVAACTISVFTEKKEAKGKVKSKPSKSKANKEGEQSNKSDTILFLGNTEIQDILEFLESNWTEVELSISSDKPSFSSNLITGLKKTVQRENKPGDIALFGRMMANLPAAKIHASVQVAHAISVHTLKQEFDFFTAVDELAKQDSTGADYLDEMGFNASTYYRFCVLDTKQLIENIGNKELAISLATAFAYAFLEAIPTGHQNQCAHHTRPAAIMGVVRKGQPISLVDAFEKPVRPYGESSLLDCAVQALDSHWKGMTEIYGNKGIEYKGITTLPNLSENLDSLQDSKENSIKELVENAIAAAFPEEN